MRIEGSLGSDDERPRVELGNLRERIGSDEEVEWCNPNEKVSRGIDVEGEGQQRRGRLIHSLKEFEMGVLIEVERDGIEQLRNWVD